MEHKLVPLVTWRTITTNFNAYYPFPQSVQAFGYGSIDDLVEDAMLGSVLSYVSIHGKVGANAWATMKTKTLSAYAKTHARKSSRVELIKLVYEVGKTINPKNVYQSAKIPILHVSAAWELLRKSLAEYEVVSDIDFISAPGIVGAETDEFAQYRDDIEHEMFTD